MEPDLHARWAISAKAALASCTTLFLFMLESRADPPEATWRSMNDTTKSIHATFENDNGNSCAKEN
ncbi:hypothetical protein IT570_04380 [Candidatus Sumerlaeota bacterium]|nr:hypothetical protein [Candidatus Sumerlaeota bacterium]